MLSNLVGLTMIAATRLGALGFPAPSGRKCSRGGRCRPKRRTPTAWAPRSPEVDLSSQATRKSRAMAPTAIPAAWSVSTKARLPEGEHPPVTVPTWARAGTGHNDGVVGYGFKGEHTPRIGSGP